MSSRSSIARGAPRDMLPTMGERADRYVIPALIGSAPVVLALLTWAPHGLTQTQETMRSGAGPVFAVELVVSIIALRQGLPAWVRENMPPAPAIAAIGVWVLVAIATALTVAPNTIGSAMWTIHWIVHLLFGFSMAFLCSRTVRIRDVVGFYVAGFLAYSVLFVTFVALYWAQPVDWVHDLPGMQHVRHVGIYSAAITAMSIGVMADSRNRRLQVGAFVVATLGFALGCWSGSRGMIAGVVGATLIGALLMPPIRNRRVLGASALALAIGVFAVAPLPVPNGKMMGVGRAVVATTQHEVTTGRVGIWANAFHAFEQRPIFGHGAGQLSIVAPYYDTSHAHNLILQVLVDWGIVGLACILVAALFYAKRVSRTVASEQARLSAPLMGALSLLVLSMTDAAIYDVFPASIFAACAGMIGARPWKPRGGANGRLKGVRMD